MVACRYGNILLVFNSIAHEWVQRVEEKSHIYARPCIILYVTMWHDHQGGKTNKTNGLDATRDRNAWSGLQCYNSMTNAFLPIFFILFKIISSFVCRIPLHYIHQKPVQRALCSNQTGTSLKRLSDIMFWIKSTSEYTN